MNEKNNARPSLAARERAVARKQRNNFIKQAGITTIVTLALYFSFTYGMYWLLVFMGRLP